MEPRTQMNAITPTQQTAKPEWSLLRMNPERPDLNHHSDNPFDFLSMAKLDMLIRFCHGDVEAAGKLTKIEKDVLGDSRIEKILVKVVCSGPSPIDEDRKNAWIRSAILSAIAESGVDAQEVAKLRIVINPAKPGYSWVIIPVRAAIFKALEDIRGAIHPRSGTLILFRPWKNVTLPTQRIYAFGIHLANDNVPFDVATRDYAEQMRDPLSKHNIRILGMTPTYYGDAGMYCTEIKFDFADGAIPFLIMPQRLTRRFRTGPGNSKTVRGIKYKWPSKCRLCESETHLTAGCPWRDIKIDNRKPDFFNCRFHSPDWVEPFKFRILLSNK